MKGITFSDGIVRATFVEEEGTLTFFGNGAVDGTRNWLCMDRDNKKSVRTIVFEDGITSVGSCEFGGAIGSDYCNLEKVIFQGDINAIASCAFSGCMNLTTVEFNGKCKKIADLAFFQCWSLEHINIPEECRCDMSAFSDTPLDNEHPCSDEDEYFYADEDEHLDGDI